ncbi:MAG TPA: alpha/beta hydrolase [Pseudonocardiaceae bacterium]|jgi:hypothetical protein|nr:alpha/beta hydrolase [Pseudonocardiaceae bacterium]
MVSYRDVKRWNVAELDQIFRDVQQRQRILVSSGEDLVRALPIDGWDGPAADSAMATHRVLVTALDHMSAGTSIVNKTIAQTVDAIPAVQRDLLGAEELAAKYGYRVDDNGSIVDVLTSPGSSDPNPADRARARQQVSDTIEQALRTADDIDADLARVLNRAMLGGFGTGTETTIQGAMADGLQESPGEVLTSPPPHGSPDQNAAWWNSLSRTGEAILLRDHPDWLGSLDGLPGAVRSTANLARVPELRAKLRQQLDDLDQQATGPFIGDDDAAALGTQIDAVQAKLRSLDVVMRTMAQGNRQLLLLDATQPRFEAAIAVGNIDTADNIAVFTPGFTTTVDGSLLGYDADMKNLKAIGDRLDLKFGGTPTAAVTWIGYQAPQWDAGLVDPSQSVVSPDAAEAGGQSLVRFYDGIGAAHGAAKTPLHLTALGHSYGSTTTGFALGQNTPVGDAILFGSPGQGSAHLDVPSGHLYDERNQGDGIVPNLHGTLGPSPYFSPDARPDYQELFTGTSTGDTGALRATSGHSGYLDDRSTSLYNMAAIAAGHPELAHYANPPLARGPR